MAELKVESVEARDDGRNLNLIIRLRNDSNQTLHAHSVVRGIHYDPTTKELKFQLTDRPLVGALPQSWYILPKLVAVDPHSTGTIELKQSRFVTRISPSSRGDVPTIEQLPAHEAASVVVEVAWSDKPFYSDPRQKKAKPMPEQVVDWERGMATGRATRHPQGPPPTPGQQGPGKERDDDHRSEKKRGRD